MSGAAKFLKRMFFEVSKVDTFSGTPCMVCSTEGHFNEVSTRERLELLGHCARCD